MDLPGEPAEPKLKPRDPGKKEADADKAEQEAVNDRCGEWATAFGRMEPFVVQRVGDLRGGAAALPQLDHAFEQAFEGVQLPVAGDRPREGVFALVTSLPVNSRVDVLAVAAELLRRQSSPHSAKLEEAT